MDLISLLTCFQRYYSILKESVKLLLVQQCACNSIQLIVSGDGKGGAIRSVDQKPANVSRVDFQTFSSLTLMLVLGLIAIASIKNSIDALYPSIITNIHSCL